MVYYVTIIVLFGQLSLFVLIFRQNLIITELTETVNNQTVLTRDLLFSINNVNNLIDKNQNEILQAKHLLVNPNPENNFLIICVCLLLTCGILYFSRSNNIDISPLETRLNKPVDISPETIKLIESSAEEIISALTKSNLDITLPIYENTTVLGYLITTLIHGKG